MEKDEEKIYYKKVENGIGIFIQHGVDFEKFDSGLGNYSTAIVEMDDGTVRNLALDLIKFL